MWPPPPDLTVSEWADQKRFLSEESSSAPGRWDTARAEYQRGIMDAFSDVTVEEVDAMKGTQVGWTDILNNVIGYHVDQDPASMLLIMPTIEIAETWSKGRLSPMIRDTPALASKFAVGAKIGSNTLREKTFPGGLIAIAGANSPSSLASRPVRIVLGDEVSKYPASAGVEGDPLMLGFKRSATYWNKKRAAGSSPTIAGSCRIEARFEKSDKRRYFVPCADCGEHQFLKWSQVRWEGADASTARYVCEHCGVLWTDAARHVAVSRGEWRATAPFKGIAGFHVPQLLSPWVSLEEIVTEWLAAQGNPHLLKIFVNTVLAETWKVTGKVPEWRHLYERAEDWKIGTAPAGVLFITIGIDVQHDRIEVYVWGWGRDLESWLIDYRVLEGDPYSRAPWDALDGVINETWRHDCGAEMGPVKVAIDSGYATTEVHKWAKRKRPDLVMVVKGVAYGSTGVGMPTAIDVADKLGKKKRRRGGTQWPVVGSIYKDELYGYLNLDAPTRESGEPYPKGYVHTPKFPEEVFKQLTAEQLVTKIKKFRSKTEWEKTRERNEALDCRVYARAAAAVYGIDRFQERHWARLEQHLVPKPKKEPAPAALPEREMPDVPTDKVAEVTAADEAAQTEQKKRKRGWLNRDRRTPWLRR